MRRLRYLRLIGTRVALPLAVSISIAGAISLVTAVDPFGSARVAARNLVLPTLVVLVLWNALAVIGRAWIERGEARRKADHGSREEDCA